MPVSDWNFSLYTKSNRLRTVFYEKPEILKKSRNSLCVKGIYLHWSLRENTFLWKNIRGLRSKRFWRFEKKHHRAVKIFFRGGKNKFLIFPQRKTIRLAIKFSRIFFKCLQWYNHKSVCDVIQLIQKPRFRGLFRKKFRENKRNTTFLDVIVFERMKAASWELFMGVVCAIHSLFVSPESGAYSRKKFG